MAEEVLLTPVQVAERLQISERTVNRWLRDGYLPGFKLGREWRIALTDLHTFMEHHANQQLDPASGPQ